MILWRNSETPPWRGTGAQQQIIGDKEYFLQYNVTTQTQRKNLHSVKKTIIVVVVDHLDKQQPQKAGS